MGRGRRIGTTRRELRNMHDIDFLPIEYHQEHAKRQWKLWRALVVAAFGVILIVAAISQYRSHGRAQAELDAILSQHETAVAQSNELAEMQSELKAARTDAELFTSMRFPWPRSRILAALLAPLPEEVTFEKLDISERKSGPRNPAKRLSKAERKAENEELEKLSPAEQDLGKLRGQLASCQTVVTISGTTSESAALHQYLGQLSRENLFWKATLSSIESDDNDPKGTMRFSATVVVRPGYGQPGGPEGKAEGGKGKDEG